MRDGYYQLAVAVLEQAVKDATRHHPTRGSAIDFLCTGGEQLALWCALAGVQPEQVQRLGQRLSHDRAA